MFRIRDRKPRRGNLYYTKTINGGYNLARTGKPLDKECNVLANCVGYANGRFAEIIGKPWIEYQFTKNAENFIEDAIEYGLEVVDYPTYGGIMVWQAGKTLYGIDGVGHVAIVEDIIDKNTILTSESSYGGFVFANIIRENDNGDWGIPGAEFRGCIVNPAVGKIYL